MTSGDNGEWVRQGTPQDDNANWNEEPSEYGTAISPAEWDDYSSEQPVPVAPPRAHTDGGAETAGSPGSPMQHDSAPVLGQEPDASEEYGADELEPFAVDAKVSDTDDEGRDSARIDDLADGEDTQAIPEYDSDEPVEEMTRPRPVAHDDTGATAVADDATFESAVEPTDDGMEPVAAEEVSGEERHVDAADYLALDPVPADELTGEPLIEANDQALIEANDEALIEANDEALIEANDEPLAAAEDDELPSATFDDDPVMTTDDVDAGNITLDDDAVVVDDNDVEEETVVAGTEDEPDLVVVEDEPTQHVDMDDMEATQAVPVAAAAPVGQEHAAHGLYRVAGAEETAVISDGSYPNQDADVAEERQQAQLEAERQAREQRLGAVQTSSDNAIREDAKPVKIVTDKVLPSFGLFVLRIVTAGILGIASYQILGSGVDATADYLGQTMIPEPRLVAWILGFTLGAMALLLVIGMLQRLVGLLLLAVAVGSLIFIRWGNFAIFNPAVEGFIGDKDLLLAAVGLLLFTIGGGAWGVDGAFRRTRASSKAEREG